MKRNLSFSFVNSANLLCYIFGTWGFSRTMHGKTAPSCGLHSQGGVRRGVRASGSYQEGTGKSGSYGIFFLSIQNVFTVLPGTQCIIKVHMQISNQQLKIFQRFALLKISSISNGFKIQLQDKLPISF